MGTLVRFNKRGRPIPAQPHESGGGKVLVFTGVRYERAPAEDAPGKPGMPKRKRKRATL